MRMNFRFIYALVMLALAALLIAGCGSKKESRSDPENDSTYAFDDDEGDVYDDEGYMDEEDDLIPIDIWNDVHITYKGWAGLGEIDQITYSSEEDYSDLITRLVTFRPEEEYHNLKDEDKVTINAVFDEQELKKSGYVIEETQKEMIVWGVPTILKATSYHEGLAWMNVRTADKEQWMAVNTDGQPVITLEPGSAPGTHFCKGVCIVNNYYLIDKTGAVVWSVDKEGMEYANAKWGEDHINSVIIFNGGHEHLNFDRVSDYVEEDFFGYAQVSINIDTFEYSGDQTGILDEKGGWRLSPDSFQGSIMDGGFGVYRVARKDPESSISDHGSYNILDNKFIWEDEMDWKKYASIRNEWEAKYYSSIHDGMIHESDSSDVFDSMGVEHDVDGFYDLSTGKVAVDLSKYRRDTLPYPIFSEGYCILHIMNDQGAKYYTVLNKQGKEMFSPRKDDYSPYGAASFVSNGLFWDNVEGEGVTYYKPDGEKAFDCNIKIIGCSDFHEGRAIVQGEDKIYYVINENGEIVF